MMEDDEPQGYFSTPVEEEPQEEQISDWEEVLKTYWCAKPAEDLADEVSGRFEEHQQRFFASGLCETIRRSYRMYHSMSPDQPGAGDGSPTFAPIFTGEDGEFVYTEVNHYRNHLLHQKSLVIPEEFNFEPRAKTSDSDALEQVDVAKALLDHAVEVRGMGGVLHGAVERALVEGRAWVRLFWDIDADDLLLEHLGSADVAYQDRVDIKNSEWMIVRGYESRWELAARAAQSGAEALAVAIATATGVEREDAREIGNDHDETPDQVEVLRFYARPTPQMPEGRYTVILRGDGVVVEDGPFPFAEIPCYSLSPSTFVGTSTPYSSSWDLMPLQTLENACISAIATRMEAFGVPNVAYQEGTEIKVGDSGLALWALPPGAPPPQVLDFMPANGALHQIVAMLEELGDKLSGVNSVIRGRPSENINSGSYAALVEAQATKFNGPVDEAVTRLASSVATGAVRMYQRLAQEPKLLALTGRDGSRSVREFKANGLDKVLRVHVERTSPLTRTHAWKQDAANQLLQQGMTNPQEYLGVVRTGQFHSLFDDPVARQAHIAEENEKMLRGEQVKTADYERHDEHIRSHYGKFDSRLRESNPQAAAALAQHITEHLQRWLMTSANQPAFLQAIQMQPAQLPMQIAMEMQKMGVNAMSGGGGGGNEPPKKGPPKGDTPNTGDRMPEPAKPAKPKEQ